MPSFDAKYFLLACHGWSASNWVAYSLNRHPKITCGHNSAAILATDPEFFDGDGLKRHIPNLRAGYLQRQNRPINDVYNDLENESPAPFVGTVHTYRMRDLPVQNRKFPTQNRIYQIANLVRHPLNLVVSGYGQFKDLFRIDLREFSWTLAKVVDQGLGIVEDICERHDIDSSEYDTICFFGACVVLGSLRQDLDALDEIQTATAGPWRYKGTVRMEDITTKPGALRRLIGDLTGVGDLADIDYLSRVYRQEKINQHNQNVGAETLQRWGTLTAWQREAFSAFLNMFELRPDYEALGYDFSFMDERSI